MWNQTYGLSGPNQKKFTRKGSSNNQIKNQKSSQSCKFYIRNVCQPQLSLGKEQKQIYKNYIGGNVQNHHKRNKSGFCSEKNLNDYIARQSQQSQNLQNDKQKVKRIIRENQQLKKVNKQLVKKISMFQRQLMELDKKYTDYESSYFKTAIADKAQIISKENIFIENYIVDHKQDDNKEVKLENEKLKKQIIYLRGKIYNDVESFKKINDKQLYQLKNKYVDLLNNFKDISKQNCALRVRLKKMQTQNPNISPLKKTISLNISENSTNSNFFSDAPL